MSEAYEVLGDEKKRQQYDTFGAAGPGAAHDAQSGFGGGGAGGFHYQSQVDPEELFRTIFGDAFQKGRDFESMFEGFGGGGGYSQPEITQVINHYSISDPEKIQLKSFLLNFFKIIIVKIVDFFNYSRKKIQKFQV